MTRHVVVVGRLRPFVILGLVCWLNDEILPKVTVYRWLLCEKRIKASVIEWSVFLFAFFRNKVFKDFLIPFVMRK